MAVVTAGLARSPGYPSFNHQRSNTLAPLHGHTPARCRKCSSLPKFGSSDLGWITCGLFS